VNNFGLALCSSSLTKAGHDMGSNAVLIQGEQGKEQSQHTTAAAAAAAA
jgi:hypothetical protein